MPPGVVTLDHVLSDSGLHAVCASCCGCQQPVCAHSVFILHGERQSKAMCGAAATTTAGKGFSKGACKAGQRTSDPVPRAGKASTHAHTQAVPHTVLQRRELHVRELQVRRQPSQPNVHVS